MPIKHFYKLGFFNFFLFIFYFFLLQDYPQSGLFSFIHLIISILSLLEIKKKLSGNLQSLKIKERRRKGGNLSLRAFKILYKDKINIFVFFC